MERKTVAMKKEALNAQARVWLGMTKENMAERRLPLKKLSEWLKAKADCKTADPRYKEISRAYFEMEKNGSKTVRFKKLADMLRELHACEMHKELMHVDNWLVDIVDLLRLPVAHKREK